jgi:hypothetical protein
MIGSVEVERRRCARGARASVEIVDFGDEFGLVEQAVDEVMDVKWEMGLVEHVLLKVERDEPRREPLGNLALRDQCRSSHGEQDFSRLDLPCRDKPSSSSLPLDRSYLDGTDIIGNISHFRRPPFFRVMLLERKSVERREVEAGSARGFRKTRLTGRDAGLSV